MKKIIRNYVLGFIWCLGLVIAGSDNSISPVVNFLGVFLIGFSSFFAIDRDVDSTVSDQTRSSRFHKVRPKFARTGS